MAYKTVKELLTVICDSIRARNGTAELISHQDIPNILDTCPYAVSGVFVPGEDVKEFSITGLPFAPTSMMLICSDEIAKSDSRTPNTLAYTLIHKGLYSGMLYTASSGGNQLGTIKPTSPMLNWTEDGITFTIPSNLDCNFKTGLVYNYYITGVQSDEVL